MEHAAQEPYDVGGLRLHLAFRPTHVSQEARDAGRINAGGSGYRTQVKDKMQVGQWATARVDKDGGEEIGARIVAVAGAEC